MFPSEYENLYDQKSSAGLFLSAFFYSTPFACSANSNTKSIGSVDQVLLQCNRELANLDTNYLAEANQNVFSNISFAKLESDRLLVKFDPLTDDGRYELVLAGVVSNSGETLANDKLPIIIDTKLPTVSLVGYIPITDYTFFLQGIGTLPVQNHWPILALLF